jgi:hypothetical protein
MMRMSESTAAILYSSYVMVVPGTTIHEFACKC